MAFDAERLFTLTSKMVEHLDEHYGEDEECHMRTAVILLEVDIGPATKYIRVSNEDRYWVLEAFLRKAADIVRREDEQGTTAD